MNFAVGFGWDRERYARWEQGVVADAKPPEHRNLRIARGLLDTAVKDANWLTHDLPRYENDRSDENRQMLLSRLFSVAATLNNILQLVGEVPNMERDPLPGGGWIEKPTKPLA